MHDSDTPSRRTVLRTSALTLLAGGVAGCTQSTDAAGGGPTDATTTADPTTGSGTSDDTATAEETAPTTDDAEATTTGRTDEAVVGVGPNGEFVFEPGTEEPLYVSSGATVRFVWRSDQHSVSVESTPDGAEWEGHDTVEDAGFEYEHTFETLGAYEFYCAPHEALGMVGEVVVTEDGTPPEGTAGETPHETTEETSTAEGGDPVRLGDDGSAEIAVGPNDEFVFEPGTDRPVSVPPGTTVTFRWASDHHSLTVVSAPAEAEWEGHDAVENAGFEYEHTFEAGGRYEFFCAPHESLGMTGTLYVEE